MSSNKSKRSVSKNYYCTYVFSSGSKKGQTCNKFIFEEDPNYCSTHLKSKSISLSADSPVKCKKKIKIEDDSPEKSLKKKKSPVNSIVKPAAKRTKKPKIEIEESEPLEFEECDENSEYLLNVKSRLIMTSDKKVIGQYHFMSFVKPEFYFVDKVSEDKRYLLDEHGLIYETFGMHTDPPSIPNKPDATYNERVAHWNQILEEKNAEANELQKNGYFRKAFMIRESYNLSQKYFTEEEKSTYFANWSKKIFNLTKKQYRLVLDNIRCGYFFHNGNKCDIELNTDHMFCNYHIQLVKSEKSFPKQIQTNEKWYANKM